MHGRSYIQSKQEQKLRNDAFLKHQNALGRVMSHERDNKLNTDYKKGNQNHWQVGASKQRAYIHRRAEREIDIERENMKLLQKLEEIKRKGQYTNQRSPELKYVKHPEELMHEKHRQSDAQRYTKQRVLQTANMRLSKHIKNAPSSISARKLEHEFMRNSSYIKMQEKTDGGKRDIVNGGFKSSPRANRFRDGIKLPPLSYKPLIKDDTNNGTMSTFHQLSELNDKSQMTSPMEGYEGEFGDQSSILAHSKPRKMRPKLVSMQMDLLTSPRGFPQTTKSMASVGQSEFASHFGKAQEEDDGIKKARETFEQLCQQEGASQSVMIEKKASPKKQTFKQLQNSQKRIRKRVSQESGFSSKKSGMSLRGSQDQIQTDGQAPPETAEDYMNKTGQSFVVAPQASEVHPGVKKSPMGKNKNKSGSFRSRGSSNQSLGSRSKKSAQAEPVPNNFDQSFNSKKAPQETVQETNNDQDEPGRPDIIFTTENQQVPEEDIQERQSNGDAQAQEQVEEPAAEEPAAAEDKPVVAEGENQE